MGRNKITTEIFIERAMKVHGDKFDYTNTLYQKLDSKVSILCHTHGIFQQNAADHLNGNGCPGCSGNRKLDTNSFIENAKNIHGNEYDYSLVKYVNNKTKITIKCTHHGMFEQQPNNHISGQGCPKCKNKKLSDNMVKSPNVLVNELNDIFLNENYIYDFKNYINNRSFIKVTCPVHGEFTKSYQSLRKGFGCADCAGYKSKGERLIGEWLKDNNIEYIPQMKFSGCMLDRELRFDYYLPKHNICIEYNGKQHYYASSKFGGEKEFELTKTRDQIKIEYCMDNSIPLIIIQWDEDPIHKLQSVFLDVI